MWWQRVCSRGLPTIAAAVASAEGLRRSTSSGERARTWRPYVACEEKPKPELVRVSYTSSMRGDGKTALQALEAIAERAAKNNIKANISGHMSYDSSLRGVWQVIEGNPDAISPLWRRINADPRHIIDQDTVTIESVQERRYPIGWGLRYLRFEQSDNPETKQDGATLVQLKYKSTMADVGGNERSIVEGLMPAAMAKNARLGVTGWMLYNDRNLTVYQVLEGPPETVDKLWEQIRSDSRHSVCLDSVKRKAITAREFDNWSMAMDEVDQSAWSQQSW